MADSLSSDLRTFLARYIDSVAQLEALLLLRNNPSQTWSADAVAKRLYTSDEESAALLARLCDDGFLARSLQDYRYACQTPELAAAVDRLAEGYKEQLIPITQLIHAKPRRIREFADAFKLKKDQ